MSAIPSVPPPPPSVGAAPAIGLDVFQRPALASQARFELRLEVNQRLYRREPPLHRRRIRTRHDEEPLVFDVRDPEFGGFAAEHPHDTRTFGDGVMMIDWKQSGLGVVIRHGPEGMKMPGDAVIVHAHILTRWAYT